MRILLTSDGSPHARPAVLFGAQIASRGKAEVTLLGIAMGPRQQELVQRELEALRDAIHQEGVESIQVKLRLGYVDEEILAETEENAYDIVVAGSRGPRHPRRFLLGSNAKRLARHIKVPILIVREPRPQIQRILVCTSGGKPGEVTAKIGGELAALLAAKVTVLHVMSQLPLTPDAKVEDLVSDSTELIQSGSREGKHLQRDLEILTQQGVKKERQHALVRHGLVLDEILREAQEGDYDLIVIGAHQVPTDLPWRELRQMLQTDIADQILTHTKRPVMVVRSIRETTQA